MEKSRIMFLPIFWGLMSFTLLAAPVQTKEIGTVHVMGVWGGEELKAFRAVAEGWEKQTGGRVEFEGTRDLAAILRARVMGGNPPDLAILPNPSLINELARTGKLKSIDQVLDIVQLRRDYTIPWLNLGSLGETFFSLFVKATTKGTIWYNPKEFSPNRWEVPQTWAQLISLSDRIVAEGKTPWSIAVESGGASGWPASDWIQEILLHESGPTSTTIGWIIEFHGLMEP